MELDQVLYIFVSLPHHILTKVPLYLAENTHLCVSIIITLHLFKESIENNLKRLQEVNKACSQPHHLINFWKVLSSKSWEKRHVTLLKVMCSLFYRITNSFNVTSCLSAIVYPIKLKVVFLSYYVDSGLAGL